VKQVFKISLIYFGTVFTVGFLLGMIRVPLVVPALGERTAELIELPFMLIAVFLAARWITDRYGLVSQPRVAFVVGVLAAIYLLLIEFSVVLWLRGLTIGEFLAGRDPVAASLYYAAIGIFALMPMVLAAWNRRNANE
jgi:hypothetical protein